MKTLNINILIHAAYKNDGKSALLQRPALIEVPKTGIRFFSGVPQSEDDANRINNALSGEPPQNAVQPQ